MEDKTIKIEVFKDPEYYTRTYYKARVVVRVNGRYLWSESTYSTRLTKEDARLDGEYLAETILLAN